MISTTVPVAAGFAVKLCGDPSIVQAICELLPSVANGSTAALELELRAVRGDPEPVTEACLELPGVRIGTSQSEIVVRTERASVRVGDALDLRLDQDADVHDVRGALDATWPLVLPRVGAYHVHGGAVRDSDGGGWLLAGSAGSGKSTTVLSLALEGWAWTSDDATYIVRDGDALVATGWPEAPRLSARSAAALRVSREEQLSPHKTPVVLPPRVSSSRQDRIVIHRLILPELGARTAIQPIDAHAALDALLRSSAWLLCLPMALATPYLRLLRDLASLPVWRMQLGPELLERPAFAAELLAERAR